MIRSTPITFNSTLKFSDNPIGSTQEVESEWRCSLRYVESWGRSFSQISKGINLWDKIAKVMTLGPRAAPPNLKQLLGRLDRISNIAGFILLGDAFFALNQKGKIGLNLFSVKEVLSLSGDGIELFTSLSKVGKLASKTASVIRSVDVLSVLVRKGKLGLNLVSAKKVLNLAEKGIELSTWLAKIEKLGFSLRTISSLFSMGLVLALLSPSLSFLMQLREEGWNAFHEIETYKISYKFGMAFLAIYLFTTATTLSAYLDIVITGTSFALSLYS